jgi:nucleotide-binding universal stress UspA family protein
MRIESVLVAMDFSESAIAGARWVVEHFAPSADVTLVCVIVPPDRPGFVESLLPPPDAFEAPAREAAELRMRDLMASIAPGARCDIRVGTPHHEILEAARTRHVDLVVVGPHGDSVKPRAWLGSTAERIVHGSTVPVLVTTGVPATRPRTLLVPVDENRLAESVLRWAGQLATSFDAKVKLLHVWSEAIYSHVASMARVGTSDPEAAHREIEKEVHDAAAHWLADLGAAGVRGRRATAIVSHGKPGDVTLDLAASSHADLIVIGRSGRGAIRSVLLGSTLRTVLHNATCPVFVVTETAPSLTESRTTTDWT